MTPEQRAGRGPRCLMGGDHRLLELLDSRTAVLQARGQVGGIGPGRQGLLLQGKVRAGFGLQLLLAHQGLGAQGRIGLRQTGGVLPLKLLDLVGLHLQLGLVDVRLGLARDIGLGLGGGGHEQEGGGDQETHGWKMGMRRLPVQLGRRTPVDSLGP